ncbi:hypothetical protein QEH42_gp300 [Microbacterium phage Pumpernickel]|uniref:Uncharacterized protein n=1 Tax=Microbacterium phage Pumpernickel TaxID=2885983 RepID=A0AAE9C2H8_9CAUD|nr:hypothetical protein QEH42_gp300 [Microbacterium phage Pumpernickel]UDL15918.1 hypothetical protein SEA_PUMPERNICKEL_157 [Microbacterium phage Pumpernickel]
MDKLELRDAWLRAEATDRGYKVSDTDACSLETELQGDGCCELCYSEKAVLVATVGGNKFEIYTY